MKPPVQRFGIITLVAAAVLFLSSEAKSQTAEKYFDTSKAKIAEADKLQWGSDLWKVKLRSSLSDLNDAIKLDPKNAAYYAKRAEVNELLDELDPALNDASAAISLAPEEPEYYTLRGSIRHSIEAIKRADEREKLEPEEAAKIVADHKAALEDYNKAVSLAPQDPRWYVKRGGFFELTEQVDAAMSDLTHAIELDARNIKALQARSMLRAQNELLKEAIEDFSRLIEIDPKMTTAYLARAEMFEKLKEYEKAIADTTLAHKTAPKSPGILEVRAERYRMIGKIALARKDEIAAKRLRRAGGR